MSEEEHCLSIRLGADAATVRLRVAKGFENDLHRLSIGFRTARHHSPNTTDVDLDDLLLNLNEFKKWPHRQGVAWDPGLATLVRDVTKDAHTLDARLEGRPPAELEIAADDLSALLGPNWTGSLTSFQQRDTAKLLSLRHGANFSVPGAGKTRVGLAIFQALQQAGEVDRVLIVGPKSSYEAWQSENNTCFATPPRLQVLNSSIAPDTEALLVNYERLKGSLNTLARWLVARPSLLILDEAHRMKLGAAGVYGGACMALGARARRRLILTGTPAPNGARDLENLLGFVWPGHGRQAVAQAVAGGNLAHASRVLRPLFSRTTKIELELPPVTVTQRPLELPPLHAEIYEALIGLYSARAATSQDDFQALGRILVYLLMAAVSPALLKVGTTRYEPLAYQVPPLPIPDGSPLMDLMRDLPSYEMSPKYRETLAIVAGNATAPVPRKTLVWSTFIRSVSTLERILNEFNPAVVHGSSDNREDEIARFREDPDCMVLISNPETLGEGINLHHSCHDAVYVDRDFAAGRFLQSLDRIHRLGLAPDTETRVTVLTSLGTIDEVVNQRLETKLQFMGRILDDPSVQKLADLDEEPAVGGGLDQEDLRAFMGHLSASTT